MQKLGGIRSWGGVRVTKEQPPRQKLSSGSSSGYRPRVDRFLFKALGIDPKSIRPPGTIEPADLGPVIDHLVAAADRPSTQALGRLAEFYPEMNPLIADGLTRAIGNPKTSRDYWVYPVECDYLAALSRYQSALDLGCSQHPTKPYRCGKTTDTEDWREVCAID